MWKYAIASFCPRVEDTDQHADVGHRVCGLWQSKAQSEETIGGYLARKVGMLGPVGHLGAAIIRYVPGVTLTLVNTVSTVPQVSG